MNSHLNVSEKKCTPQLRSVFESFSTQLSIGDLEKLRLVLKREISSANLALSSSRVFDELVKSGCIDETNQAQLAEFCRSIGRYDLLTIIGGRRAVPVVDPVEEFIKDRQIAENKHAKKYTLKKQDEQTNQEQNERSEYTGPLTRSRKRLHEQLTDTSESQVDTAIDESSVSAAKNLRAEQRCEQLSNSVSQPFSLNSSQASSTRLTPQNSSLRSTASTSATCISGQPSAAASVLPNLSARRVVTSNSITSSIHAAPGASTATLGTGTSTLIRKKETCDVNLRVRAEYQDHEAALTAAVGSSRETETERQFERFAQANQVLRSRDLGAIVCEIKFSELTYLDAFWRDYINGSLLHALRDVFITESLRQAVNYEQVRLLITVDEDDYEMGRTRLVHNL